jgi:hypothetical protein
MTVKTAKQEQRMNTIDLVPPVDFVAPPKKPKKTRKVRR